MSEHARGRTPTNGRRAKRADWERLACTLKISLQTAVGRPRSQGQGAPGLTGPIADLGRPQCHQPRVFEISQASGKSRPTDDEAIHISLWLTPSRKLVIHPAELATLGLLPCRLLRIIRLPNPLLIPEEPRAAWTRRQSTSSEPKPSFFCFSLVPLEKTHSFSPLAVSLDAWGRHPKARICCRRRLGTEPLPFLNPRSTHHGRPRQRQAGRTGRPDEA